MEKKQTAEGTKAYQRDDSEHRAKPYLEWRRHISGGLYLNDIDSIEWRVRGGELIPVAVIEVTRVDIGKSVGEGYLAAITDRFMLRDKQGYMTKYIADKLGVKAYINLFRQDNSEFWLYSFDKKIWLHRTPAQMVEFLQSL